MDFPLQGGFYHTYPVYMIRLRRSIPPAQEEALSAVVQPGGLIGGQLGIGRYVAVFTDESRADEYLEEAELGETVLLAIEDAGHYRQVLAGIPPEVTYIAYDPPARGQVGKYVFPREGVVLAITPPPSHGID
jgi:hypothetical protein